MPTDIDPELFFCTEVLGLTSLHFGYWENGDDLTLCNLRKAQARYAEHLIDLMPAAVDRVLDVGCGTGELAQTLAGIGYDVTAISPDGNHPRYFANGQCRITYVQSRFEDLEIDRRFDLVLMAESQNYIDTDAGLAQCRRYLRPHGHLLVSGIFRREDMPVQDPFPYLSDTVQDFTRHAGRAGLRLVSTTDITEQVLPTLELFGAMWRRYATPMEQLANIWKIRRPLIARLVSFALRSDLQELRNLQQRFDPHQFSSNCRYVTLRFDRGPA